MNTTTKKQHTRMWLIMQPTRSGERYFLGGYPQEINSWTGDIRKAARFSAVEVANITEHCAAYTCGERPRKVRSEARAALSQKGEK